MTIKRKPPTPSNAPASNGASNSIPAEVADALVKRCKAQAMSLGWKFPFFLPAIARITFRADIRYCNSACVDLRGIIRVHPDFAARQKDTELQFVIAHELMHLLMLHHDRRAHRDPLRWNLATDRIINRTLQRSAEAAGSGAGIFTMPKEGVIADEDQANLTAEQLYQLEPEPPASLRQMHVTGLVPVGQGCGPLPGESDGQDPTEIEAQLNRQWREVAAQAQMSGRQAGDTAGSILADLLDVPPPKVRWAELLRGALHRALAEAGRDDVSWSRRSRRSSVDIILPGGVTHRCRAAVVIDSSGSMSDEQLARCVAETTAIVNHTQVPAFLVVHDHCIQAACWIRPGARGAVHTQVKAQMKGRGGTSFDEAYQRVEKEPGRFNTMTHLTDGEVGSWPAKPANVKQLVIALVDSPLTRQPDWSPKLGEVWPADARCIEVEL